MLIDFNTFQQMSLGAYEDQESARTNLNAQGWTSLFGDNQHPFVTNSINGFNAMTLTRPNADGTIDVVISFRGTDDNIDGLQDALLVTGSRGALLDQFTSANNYYQSVVNNLIAQGDDPSKLHISFTGHSLGGTLAQYMGAITGDDATAFNPAGSAQLLADVIPDYTNRNYDNIKSYILEGDVISNSLEQIGQTYFYDPTAAQLAGINQPDYLKACLYSLAN